MNKEKSEATEPVPVEVPMEKTSSMEDFFIIDEQNEGILVPLVKPDGTESDHSLTLYGHFSDNFQKVRREVLAEAPSQLKSLSKDEVAREKMMNEQRLRLTAALIKDWSFDIPCSTRQKMEFLRKAPQIMQMVDRVAGEISLFTQASSKPSGNGSDGASSSPAQSKAQRKV